MPIPAAMPSRRGGATKLRRHARSQVQLGNEEAGEAVERYCQLEIQVAVLVRALLAEVVVKPPVDHRSKKPLPL